MVVVAECFRIFVCRMYGQLRRGTSFFVHNEHIEVSVAVGSECDLFSVGRPDRACVVGRMGC